MVTKRTGNPPGRPKKKAAQIADEPRLARAPGRPKIPFRQHPDRYLVALIEAHRSALKMSERKASMIVAAFDSGNEISPDSKMPSDISEEIRKHFNKCPNGLVPIAWGPLHEAKSNVSYVNTKHGSRAATIEGRAASLRQTLRDSRNDRADEAWILLIAACFGMTLIQVPDIRFAIVLARKFASTIGEGYFVEKFIIPKLLEQASVT